MVKLNQIIAIEKGVKSRAYAQLSELNNIAQKPTLFNGLSRTYQKKDEDGEDLPAERSQVQAKVSELLDILRLSQTQLYDVTAQKDIANQLAVANVVVDGVEVIPDLPVTTLLFLEKQLTDLRTFFGNLPVLDSAENWSFDANSGLQRADPSQSQRTKKLQKPIVLYPATDKHPAQTQLVTEDVAVGTWTAVRQSGAIAKPEKQKLIDRVEKLLLAVKEARERANDAGADSKPAVGAAVFNYLLG